MSKSIYNTFGTITKKEKVASVENETNSNILILETLIPFPGYHGSTVPDRLEPDSLFAITRVSHKEDVIQRVIQEVRRELSIDLEAAPATINLQNESRSAVRFKGLKYSMVGEILDEFRKQGIAFRKAKKFGPTETIIKVHKFFSLKKLKDNFYRDSEDECMNYFTIPTQLRWNSFEKMTMSCKYNCSDKNFDAAIATVYMDNNIIDFVRIYDKNSSVEKLEDIRNKYLDAISKF
jgi:hypothetical protein